MIDAISRELEKKNGWGISDRAAGGKKDCEQARAGISAA
jgi:hypothetical protein